MSHLIPRAEIDFLLHDWLGAASAEHSRETIDALMDLSERLAREAFLPHYREADTIEPKLEHGEVRILPAARAALDLYRDLGLFSASFAPELGGMGLPTLVCHASFAQFLAANPATAGYVLLTNGNSRLIATFGNAAQVEQFALPQIAGRWFGTMCLSEPQAGSGLGDITTRAVPDGEDALGQRYRLIGNKMWISGGDQDASENIVHLVLAKVPNKDGRLPEGTKGISLFIVPKVLPDGARNDVTVAALNHKMGYRGTSNCALNFGEAGGATGWLVGEQGHGLRQMFLMMNEARVVIGLGAAALAWRGYRHAAEYATQRSQGRRAGESGGMPVPIIEHADVRHMLLAQKAWCEGALALCLYGAKLVDQAEADPEAAGLLDLLTPIIKTWPSEHGLAANDLAIQVHGGYGYTRDFPVEQVYRDNRLNPIHEGTTGIQAIDLVGRKLLRDDSQALGLLWQRIEETAKRAAGRPALAARGTALLVYRNKAAATVAALRMIGAPRALDNATPVLRGLGHVVVAWLLLDMALVADTLADGALRTGKMHSARYFFEVELPKAEAWLDFASSGSDVALAAPLDIF